MGKRHFKGKHFATKHLASQHLAGPPGTGLGHFAARHFKSAHWANRHLAGGLPIEVPDEEEKPQPVGGGSIDRNRAKRIGTFPDLPRFRTRKKRDEELLIFL
jgi:hypothetical protein